MLENQQCQSIAQPILRISENIIFSRGRGGMAPLKIAYEPLSLTIISGSPRVANKECKWSIVLAIVTLFAILTSSHFEWSFTRIKNHFSKVA